MGFSLQMPLKEPASGSFSPAREHKHPAADGEQQGRGGLGYHCWKRGYIESSLGEQFGIGQVQDYLDRGDLPGCGVVAEVVEDNAGDVAHNVRIAARKGIRRDVDSDNLLIAYNIFHTEMGIYAATGCVLALLLTYLLVPLFYSWGREPQRTKGRDEKSKSGDSFDRLQQVGVGSNATEQTAQFGVRREQPVDAERFRMGAGGQGGMPDDGLGIGVPVVGIGEFFDEFLSNLL